jgi:hypothetical protein
MPNPPKTVVRILKRYPTDKAVHFVPLFEEKLS